jgi:hypothetical protein
MQAALQEGLRTARELHRKAEEIVAASAEALLEVDMDEGAALAYLREATPGILRWGVGVAARAHGTRLVFWGAGTLVGFGRSEVRQTGFLIRGAY